MGSLADRALLIQQAEQGVLSALQAIQALKALPDQPTPEPAVAPPGPASGLVDPKAFFDHMRASKIMGPVLTTEEVTGCGAILDACAEASWPLADAAYALATAWHETAGTMQPIHEFGGAAYLARMYDIQGARPNKARELGNIVPGDGVKYAGRGYVQLTGRTNYCRAGNAVGVNLVADPDLALRPDIAAKIMVQGMRAGWFTARDLDDDLPRHGPATRDQFIRSRDIINGSDKAETIAEAAMVFQEALTKGNWQ